jgi:hypothetical protein
MARQVFTNSYQLNPLPGGGYAVVDAATAQPGTQPFATAVVVRAPGDKVLDSPGDTFRVGTGNAPTYSYLGTMTDTGGNILGIVGEREGIRYLFTEQSGLDSAQTLQLQSAGGSGGTQWSLQNDGPLCFMPGTHVATPSGEVAVEALKAGDLVLTAEGASAPVRWIGHQTFSRLFGDPARILPIRIRAGALGGGLPRRDLRVSPDHALLVDGVLVQAGALVNGTSILRDEAAPLTFTYFHVELADHALVLAEGVPAETFIDNVDRMAFDNWAEHEAIADSAAPMAELPLPRVRAARQLPAGTRARLAATASELGVEVAAAA